MSKDKSGTDTSGQQNQTTTVQRTPEQLELDKLQLEQQKAFDPIQRELNQRGGNLINQLLAGDSNLPGFLSRLPGGIDEGVTADIARNSIRDIQPFFQQSGLLDSGVNASVSGRIAGDIRRSSEEFNLGNLLNLLNLAVGGQAQVQSSAINSASLLSQRLAQAAGTTTSGSFNTSSRSFVQPSFLTNLNRTLGSGGAFGSGGALSPTDNFNSLTSGVGNILGGITGGGCWVASEIFGGWNEPKTIGARVWLNLEAPRWVRNFYMRFGERIASFIKDKPMLKRALRPFFEWASVRGWRWLNGER